MIDIGFKDIETALADCFGLQERAVAEWHDKEPGFRDPEPAAAGLDQLKELVLRQHWTNFSLWHVEDRARRRDVGPEVIAECKYAIDGLNQRRNDLIEKVDACLVALMAPLIPQGAGPGFNTETLGQALDRLSILQLKLFHMLEQTRRKGVGREHVAACLRKHAILDEQRRDLSQGVLDLVSEYRQGLKRPKVYYQFKMYNDPALNPELYGPGAGDRGGAG
ncbi:MAG: DUF4254 domain-containing protein [Desulfovibrionaceae bacterium]|nr:DUF4254 domain-containing protein [Desulfovibrionaceae bacterium]MDD4951230.1 DUF4254 domain-containing protein [Desulfovibrionaceae bacterium]